MTNPQSKIQSNKKPRSGKTYALGVALLAGAFVRSSMTYAAPPLQPTNPPYYSFDAASPSISDGLVTPGDVLLPGLTAPNVVISGASLGLFDPNDDLNALSLPNTGVGTSQQFTILFSVDRASAGAVPPDAALDAQGVPYNAADQASKGQAAGDQFISLSLFTRTGGPLGARGARAVDNNVLLRNNYDEGGVDFNAEPPASAEEDETGSPQDNVNATGGTSTSRAAGVPIEIFFSVGAGSPSLPELPGTMPSAANLYFNPDPSVGAMETRLFASFADLGLGVNDDIGAVLVFEDGDRLFNGQDQVVFSLQRNSPALATLIAGELASPGDLFTVNAGGAPQRFATASDFGLDPVSDNIDALDFLPCTDALACAALHGIRRPDIPTVSTWGMIFMVMLILASGSVIFIRRRCQLA